MKTSLLDQIRDAKSKFSDEQMKIVEGLLSRQEKELEGRSSILSFLTPLIATFGLVTTFYGFEKVLDQTFLIDQPGIMLLVGVLILLLTGVYYRKLQ